MKALAAEMTESFLKRLSPLGLKVRELTGDMQLTKKEIEETQVSVRERERSEKEVRGERIGERWILFSNFR